jgi:hypothetical protein
MLKQNTTFAILAIPVIVLAVALLTVTQPLEASAPAAGPADVFACTPTGVAAFTNRVHVRCSAGGPPNNTVFYFAYCSTQDSALASRFLSIFTTAKVTGKNIDIFYNPTDLSGATCGCSTADCRVLTGAEVKP